jgi:hypothetical protein
MPIQSIVVIRGKILRARRERKSLHTPGMQQTLQRPSYGGVIVDDVYEWVDVRQSVVPSHEEQIDHVSIRGGGGIQIRP